MPAKTVVHAQFRRISVASAWPRTCLRPAYYGVLAATGVAPAKSESSSVSCFEDPSSCVLIVLVLTQQPLETKLMRIHMTSKRHYLYVLGPVVLWMYVKRRNESLAVRSCFVWVVDERKASEGWASMRCGSLPVDKNYFFFSLNSKKLTYTIANLGSDVLVLPAQRCIKK